MKNKFFFVLSIALYAGITLYFSSHYSSSLSRLFPDDTFYYLLIAENIAEGNGSVSGGNEPTNGYHPLWMLVLAGTKFFTGAVKIGFIAEVLVLCSIFTFLAAYVFSLLVARITGNAANRSVYFFLFLFNPWLLNLNMSGLETSLYLFMFLMVFLFYYDRISGEKSTIKDYLLFGFATGLLMLSRTDSILYVSMMYVSILFARRKSRIVLSGLLASILVLPWLLWNYFKFGTIVQSSGVAIEFYLEKRFPDFLTLRYFELATRNIPYTIYNLIPSIFLKKKTYMEGYGIRLETALSVLVFVLFVILALNVCKKKTNRCIVPVLFGSALTGIFYIYFRLFVQVWHFASIALILLILLVVSIDLFLSKKGRSEIVIAVMLVLSVFSLRAGFFYPQEGNERQSNYGGLTGWAIQFENDAPKRLRIGYTDSGALGYFSRHEIINLDGVVNNRVLQYIKQGRFSDYLELMKLDEVYVDPERLQIYDYRKWKKVTEIRP